METNKLITCQSLDLIMKYGIRSVSMDDIAKACGISKKTIYQSFENKESLIEQIINDHIDEEREIIAEAHDKTDNALDAMILVARHIITFLREMKPSLIFDLKKYYPKLWKLIEEKHFHFIYETIKGNIEQGVREGYYASDINPDIIAKLYMQQSLSITNEDFFPLSDYQRSELFRNLVLYHIRGIMSEKGMDSLKNIEIE